MKIIEAMKRVKANKEKVTDLQGKILSVAANLSFETPLYGTDTKGKIDEWLQSCLDTSQENVRLLTAIARTNLATRVTITLGDKSVTKTIAEWIWRRREYAQLDYSTYQKLTDRGLKEGNLPTSTGVAAPVTIQRHYDPSIRDKMMAIFASERNEIDAQMEVVNAVTDLLE
jgi:hypothetical protein